MNQDILGLVLVVFPLGVENDTWVVSKSNIGVRIPMGFYLLTKTKYDIYKFSLLIGKKSEYMAVEPLEQFFRDKRIIELPDSNSGFVSYVNLVRILSLA